VLHRYRVHSTNLVQFDVVVVVLKYGRSVRHSINRRDRDKCVPELLDSYVRSTTEAVKFILVCRTSEICGQWSTRLRRSVVFSQSWEGRDL